MNNKVSVIWTISEGNVNILEVINTEDIIFVLNRQSYYMRFYDNVNMTSGVECKTK